MTEEEYTTFVREGMYRRKHRVELEQSERRRKDKEEKEQQREVERERVMKEQERLTRKLQRQKGDEEERKRKEERGRWKDRWKKLAETGGEIEESELRFADIPWPIYHHYHSSKSTTTFTSEEFTIDNVRTFLHAMAEDEAAVAAASSTNGSVVDVRKVVREAIRNYHPDRFHGRVLPRVREKDRDRVKEGVERLSRVLNDLAAETK